MTKLALEFSNGSSHKDADIHIGFVPGAGTDFSIENLASNSPIRSVYHDGAGAGIWYGLADLADGVSVTSFSGRIYLCYGPTWTVVNDGYEPAQTPTDPNFFLRYDKVEMTYTGNPADVADLTSIDYWAIPMSLETYKGTEKVSKVSGLLGKNTSAQSIFDALTQITRKTKHGLPALVPGQFKQMGTGPKPGKTFARIIGPSSYPPLYPAPGGVPVTPYDRWQGYLKYLLQTFGPGTKKGGHLKTLGNGVIANIAGDFAGVGPNPPASGPTAPQKYNYLASIDTSLDITLNSADGTAILYKNEDLMNPSGIYGGNTPYYLNGASSPTNPGNDIYGWIGGDLFSGLNIGAVGSPAQSGKHYVGDLPSSQWFSLPLTSFFSGLQPGKPFFNQWAATLSPLSDAYNFAYSDRFAPVLASLNPKQVDTLKVILENDQLTM